MPGDNTSNPGPRNTTPVVPSWIDDQPITNHEFRLVTANKCPRCRGCLDTGWECTDCGYDAQPIAARLRI